MSAIIKDKHSDRNSALLYAKDLLLERATQASRGAFSAQGTSSEEAAAFLRRYYRHVAADDLVGRSAEEVLETALSHRSVAGHRPQGTAAVRVSTPEGEGHSLVEVVCDDMPFLVDTVTTEISRHGRAIHLVIHPQLVVRRDVTGRLIGVCDASSREDAGPDCVDAVVESWIHAEIDRETDEAEVSRLTADLNRVLRDVREAVEDWPKTRALALQLAERIAVDPPVGIPDQEVAEATELLRWLADDHFTFLGSREYTLTVDEVDGQDRLRAVPGTGLGILRTDQAQGEDVGRLPVDISERARQRQILVITKANSRSTVHRPAYLDYVGVKSFDDAGQVTGERRFLGLFTSAAYNESIQRMPVLRRKAREVLVRSGFTSTSHSGKDLLQILETYPRDELFQIAVDDLEQIVVSVLHLQERRQLRLFLRRDDYGRFMSCMVYLPRDRYTTQVRQAMEAILLDAFDGVSIDYTALVSESVLARLHFVVRVDAGHAVPDVDPVDVETRLVAATRSWDDDFADALVDSCGEERANELAARYGEAFPEAYKEDLPARAAVEDLHRLEALQTDEDIDLALYAAPGAAEGDRRLKLFHTGEPVSLSLVLPRLQRMGVEVTDERPYEI
ncbi:MAG: NAD-glutamate dehydrogenase, partial [Actinomycetes bacterium]